MADLPDLTAEEMGELRQWLAYFRIQGLYPRDTLLAAKAFAQLSRLEKVAEAARIVAGPKEPGSAEWEMLDDALRAAGYLRETGDGKAED